MFVDLKRSDHEEHIGTYLLGMILKVVMQHSLCAVFEVDS